jgi:hypothetical protein
MARLEVVPLVHSRGDKKMSCVSSALSAQREDA